MEMRTGTGIGIDIDVDVNDVSSRAPQEEQDRACGVPPDEIDCSGDVEGGVREGDSDVWGRQRVSFARAGFVFFGG